MEKPENPTKDQIRNCASWGWEYLGDGIFAKNDTIGYFTKNGFKKVSADGNCL